MANYTSTARTNYFRVKDVEAFKTWAETLHLEIVPTENGEEFAVFPRDYDGSFPSVVEDNEETEQEIDFVEELRKHLAEGSVAVVIEVGAEASRYLVGVAQAFEATGEVVEVSLNDIYALARAKFQKPIPMAEH